MHNLPALAAVLVSEGEIVEMAAAGLRAYGYDEMATAGDLWHIGSLTKAMTATLAGVLVERGDIAWTSTVGEIFPDLVDDMDPQFVDVRLDELLYHQAGLTAAVTHAPSWNTNAFFTGSDPIREQRRAFAAELLAMDPAGERGHHLYSNGGYVIAGAMMEEETGESWEALIEREVFTPLGMNSTGFGPPGTPGSRDQPWGHGPAGDSWRPIEPGPFADNPPALGPAGTVHTTLEDYARYMAEHVAGARGVDGLVSAQTFDKLHTPAPGSGYAFGWGVGERPWAGGRVLSHAGSNSMWWAVVWLAPERDLAMFAVTNAGAAGAQPGTDAAVVALIRRLQAAEEGG
jgi:CubicO group peptidase (beta-lactamase class C family)